MKTNLTRCLLSGLLTLAATSAGATDLIWNTGAGNFVGSPTWSYDNGGSVATTDNPFTFQDLTSGGAGENNAFIGNGGDVTL